MYSLYGLGPGASENVASRKDTGYWIDMNEESVFNCIFNTFPMRVAWRLLVRCSGTPGSLLPFRHAQFG